MTPQPGWPETDLHRVRYHHEPTPGPLGERIVTPRPDTTTSPDEGVYVISVAAELLGCHPQTLRGYERQGLLNPTRTPGGTRLYSDLDMARARRVIELRNDGLTLGAIARILPLEDRVAELTRPSAALVPYRGGFEERLAAVLADVTKRQRASSDSGGREANAG